MAQTETQFALNYEPVQKMQQKAAAIRAELAGFAVGVAPTQEQQKTGVRDRLTVKISEPGEPVRNDRAPATPGNPRFKPQRPHIGQQTSSRPTSALSRRNTDTSGMSAAFDLGLTRGESNRWSAGQGTEPGSPTGSIGSSKRSVSPNRRSTSALKLSLALQETNQQLITRVTAAEDSAKSWQHRYKELEEEGARRQESYMRREEGMQALINDLKVQLAQARGERSAEVDARFGQANRSIQDLHAQVEAEIEDLLNKQAVALKHEEHTALRKFKTRLAEVEAELGAERGAQGRSATDWMERTRALREELNTVQDIAGKLDKMYKLSEEECARLRAQFKCQEDDREFLIREIVGLKKENKRLTVELAAMAADAQAAVQERDDLLASHRDFYDPGQQPTPMTLAGIDKDAVQLKVQRYEDVIDSLKRLVEAERKRTRQARAAHMVEVATRTELQTILRQCVDDIRARRQNVEAGGDDPALHGHAGGGLASGHSSQRSSASGSTGHPLNSSMGGARVRPFSAMPGSMSSGRPLTARAGASNFSASGAARGGRPFSAAPRSAARPFSALGTPGTARAALGLGGGGGARGTSGAHGSEAGQPLLSEEREALIQELAGREELLKALFDKAFPAVAPPTLPGDSERLDRIAAGREARDVAVVANGKALALMKATGSGIAGSSSASRPPAVPNSTPGGEVAKETAGRPWVFSVDAMLADFLQGKGS